MVRKSFSLVLLQNDERVPESEGRLLHDHVKVLDVVMALLQSVDPLQRVLFTLLDVLHLLVGDQSLTWLLALLVEHTEVVPDLALLRVQARSLDDSVERLVVVLFLIEDDGLRSPVSGFPSELVDGILEVLFRLVQVALVKGQAAVDVRSVSLSGAEVFSLLQVLDHFVKLFHHELAPGHVLVDPVVLLVTEEGSFILTHGLSHVVELLVEQADLDQGVRLAALSEGVRQDRILEVRDGLLHLVGFGEDHSKLEENFTLLIEVGGHLQDGDQGTDGVVVRLELLVEDTDSVPQLGVLDVFQAVQRTLVSVERVLEVFHQEVAVTKGGPSWAVLRIDSDHLHIMLDGRLVISVGSEELSQLIDPVHVRHVVAVTPGVDGHSRSLSGIGSIE
mmetsp:Transcript_18485/g.28364  ORF Transcript_18485/g.28364 Transcript_18485/m.28364 type:complete len:390 (+) Transcript_18485:428-1597(+)